MKREQPEAPSSDTIFSLETINDAFKSIEKNLTEVEIIKKSYYSSVKKIPKKINTTLQDAKQKLRSIHDFLAVDSDFTPESDTALLKKIQGLYRRISDVVLAWSGQGRPRGS